METPQATNTTNAGNVTTADDVARHTGLSRWLSLRGGPLTIPGMLDRQASLFSQMSLLILIVVWVVVGWQIVLTTPGASFGMRVGAGALYLACLGVILLVRSTQDIRVFLAGIIISLPLIFWLNVTFAGGVSEAPTEFLLFFVLFRLPWRWSLAVAAPLVVTLIITLLARDPSARYGGPVSLGFWLSLATAGLVTFGAFSFRSRALTMQELRETQERLRRELERNERLAIARERARIARDMHDVLAHSLTLLSVQIQAARQLALRDPQRTAQLLDEMADVAHESIGESRCLVSVLREVGRPTDGSPIGARLRASVERFADRSGVRGAFEELGEARALDDEQAQALHFALQEALTNAFRHGAARHVWATLRWEPLAVTLDVRDDGSAPDARLAVAPADGAGERAGGGNGLRGMRERATLLGGSLTAGPQDDEGYAIRMLLPLTPAAPPAPSATPASPTSFAAPGDPIADDNARCAQIDREHQEEDAAV